MIGKQVDMKNFTNPLQPRSDIVKLTGRRNQLLTYEMAVNEFVDDLDLVGFFGAEPEERSFF